MMMTPATEKARYRKSFTPYMSLSPLRHAPAFTFEERRYAHRLPRRHRYVMFSNIAFEVLSPLLPRPG